MVRPLENQERLSTSEYINRIRQSERGHGAQARDFAYEIQELSDEERRERHASRDFGQDTYEHADGDEQEAAPESTPPTPPRDAATPDDGNLDITV